MYTHYTIHGHRARSGRNGFAIITVVVMIAMVAACLVVLGEMFSYQLKLTHHTIARLQVDLLLNAGMQCVAADLRNGVVQTRPWTVPLPAALVQHTGSLAITPHAISKGILGFAISAGFSGLHARRVMEFQRRAGHWRLTKVMIPGSHFGTATFQKGL
jgi:hypothetical protein